ncbi:MAG: hypothetical protein ACOX8W_04580 [bacterium]|jgi:hypothetical protein
MDKVQLAKLLKLLLAEELTEDTRLLTLREAGIPTENEGLVVRFAHGQEFQIMIIQTKSGNELKVIRLPRPALCH